MIKMVALLKLKAGLTRDEFVDYYETKHVPLVLKHMPQIAQYRRSYVLAETMIYAGHMKGEAPPPPAFDVMTEVWCENQEQLDELMKVTADPGIGEIIAKDEENFFDRSSMTMFLVDERISRI